MKNLFRTTIVIAMCLLTTACGQVSQVAPSPVPTTTTATTISPTATPIPSATAVIEPTTTYVPPTLIPTIDPTIVPELLRNAFSIQTLEGINGHNIQKISGWDYGFRQKPCYGYQWLDSNHLLLYPRTGEGSDGFHLGKIDLSSELVVINLTNGSIWLQQPLSSTPFSFWGLDCNVVYWSQELGIIINQETPEAADSSPKESIIVHKFDGKEIARYEGKISGVSPSGTKILINDKAVIDIRNGKITNLEWSIGDDVAIYSKLYWTSDETRLYRCCFYYADIKTGKSYNFEWDDLRGVDGKPASFSLHPHADGQWVRNDTYFFVKWHYPSWEGDPFLIFSPSEKKFYSIKGTKILPLYASYAISPDGKYAWISGILDNGNDEPPHGSLVNLTTLETTSYDDIPVNDFVWSADSKFGWTDGFDSNNAYVLSVVSKKLLPFPVNPIYEFASWHPKDHVLAYLTENNQTFAILNAKDMTVHGWKLPFSISGYFWSPEGDRVAFVSTDGSLWQVDYPKLDNFEQLTSALPDVTQLNWSPDDNSIAFVSGPDIYVVDAVK